MEEPESVPLRDLLERDRVGALHRGLDGVAAGSSVKAAMQYERFALLELYSDGDADRVGKTAQGDVLERPPLPAANECQPLQARRGAGARAGDGAPARLRLLARGAARARGRAALCRAQDAHDRAGAAASAEGARPRLPVSGLRQPALRRCAPHRALGTGRRDEPRQPDLALPSPPPARARGRLRPRARPRR